LADLAISSLNAFPEIAEVSVNISFTCTAACTGDCTISEYRWDFENDGVIDLTTSTGYASHSYATKGGYTVSCTVVSDNNLTANATVSVEIEESTTPTSVYGTTIITHGYQLLATEPSRWVEAMAWGVLMRVGTGCIWKFNKTEGKFEQDICIGDGDAHTGEQVMIYDWAAESDSPFHGYSEAAGDSLFVALLYAKEKQGVSLDHLHFIGHSRGTVVNSEAVERLLASGEVNNVEQVTTLDSVWDGASGISNDHDVNQNNYLGDRGVGIWNGIIRADNYFSLDDCGEYVHLSGKSFVGIYNESHQDLTGRGSCKNNPDQGNIGHSGVHTWYYGTIDLAAKGDQHWLNPKDDEFAIFDLDWYWSPYLGRDKDGYNYSRVAGATITSGKNKFRDVVNFDYEVEGILNGDFSRGFGVPGWSSNLAGGFFNGPDHLSDAQLGPSETILAHSFFYLPATIGKIRFRCRIGDSLLAKGTLFVSLKSMFNGFEKEIYSKRTEDLSSQSTIEIDLGGFTLDHLVSLIFKYTPDNNDIDNFVKIYDVSLVKNLNSLNTTNYFDNVSDGMSITSFPLADGSNIVGEGTVAGKIYNNNPGLQIGAQLAHALTSDNSNAPANITRKSETYDSVTINFVETVSSVRLSLADFGGNTIITAYNSNDLVLKTLSVAGSTPATYTVAGVGEINYVEVASTSGWLGSIGYTLANVVHVNSDGHCNGDNPCFPTIDEGYTAARENATIKMKEGTYEGDLIFDNAKSITISGGWNDGYGENPSFSKVLGAITITSGTLGIENLEILKLSTTGSVY